MAVKERVIEVGDVVVLKSGSDPLVVTAIIQGSDPKPGYTKVDTLQACCWRPGFEEVLKYVVVPSSCVRLYVDPVSTINSNESTINKGLIIDPEAVKESKD